jgi:hypothetical protein
MEGSIPPCHTDVYPLWADPPSEDFRLLSTGFASHKQFRMKWDEKANPVTSYNNVIIINNNNNNNNNDNYNGTGLD